MSAGTDPPVVHPPVVHPPVVTPPVGQAPVPLPEAHPSGEELAAIMAAVEVLWPRPVPAPPAGAAPTNPWRFSGRSWARPLTARRDRPWVATPRS